MNRITQQISKRLVTLRGDRSQRQFAKDLGVRYQNIQRQESGEVLPSVKSLVALAQYEHVNLNWLIYGVGLPYRNQLSRGQCSE